MKFRSFALLASCTSSLAFAPASIKPQTHSQLNAHRQNEIFKSIENNVKGAVVATFLAGAVWTAPAALIGDMSSTNPFLNEIRTSVVADAKEMASGSGSRVNKDPESLLRLGLPIPKDKEVSLSYMN